MSLLFAVSLGKQLSSHQDPWWLLLLCLWALQLTGWPRLLLRGDGTTDDRNHQVSWSLAQALSGEKVEPGTRYSCMCKNVRKGQCRPHQQFTCALFLPPLPPSHLGSLARRRATIWTCVSESTRALSCVGSLAYTSGSLTCGPMTSLLPMLWRLEEHQGMGELYNTLKHVAAVVLMPLAAHLYFNDVRFPVKAQEQEHPSCMN